MTGKANCLIDVHCTNGYRQDSPPSFSIHVTQYLRHFQIVNLSLAVTAAESSRWGQVTDPEHLDEAANASHHRKCSVFFVSSQTLEFQDTRLVLGKLLIHSPYPLL